MPPWKGQRPALGGALGIRCSFCVFSKTIRTLNSLLDANSGQSFSQHQFRGVEGCGFGLWFRIALSKQEPDEKREGEPPGQDEPMAAGHHDPLMACVPWSPDPRQSGSRREHTLPPFTKS